MPQLTVILTLFGRHLHTLRWMWHANRVKLPFHVIVADGEVDPYVERLLSEPANFPNLSYEYHRFADLSYKDFYRKCATAVAKVKTPYVMISDNDDFLVVTGILRCISYLDHSPDYVCAGGKIPYFTLASQPKNPHKVVGNLACIEFGSIANVCNMASSLASERILDVVSRYNMVYYNVYRTPILTLLFEECEKLAFTDLLIWELFLAARTATLGKVMFDPSLISYIRQAGTSSQVNYIGDWVHHLLKSDLPLDCRKYAEAIACELERLEDLDAQYCKNLIIDSYAARLRYSLSHILLPARFPRVYWLKAKLSRISELTSGFLCIRKHFKSASFWNLVSNYCHNKSLLLQYRTELDQITATLQGQAFDTFARLNAPELFMALEDKPLTHISS